MFAQTSEIKKSKSESKHVVTEKAQGSAPALKLGHAMELQASESKLDLSTVINEVEKEVSTWTAFARHSKNAEHIPVLKCYAENKSKNHSHRATAKEIEASIYYIKFLYRTALLRPFVMATKPLRDEVNNKNKICQVLQYDPVRPALDKFLTSRDRAMLQSVSVRKTFCFFVNEDRKKCGDPINFRAQPTLETFEFDRPADFMFLNDKNAPIGLKIGDFATLQVMRDSRVAKIKQLNVIIIYKDTALSKEDCKEYKFPYSNEADQITSIDILTDGRFVVGKKNRTIELYTQELKQEQMPVPKSASLSIEQTPEPTRSASQSIEPTPGPAENLSSFNTMVTALNTGEIISNHLVSQTSCYLIIDPLTGKTTKLETGDDATNVVDLPYGHFAMVCEDDECELELAIYSSHNCKVVKKVKLGLETDSEDIAKPRLYAQKGALLIYANDMATRIQFPSCIPEAKLNVAPRPR